MQATSCLPPSFSTASALCVERVYAMHTASIAVARGTVVLTWSPNYRENGTFVGAIMDKLGNPQMRDFYIAVGAAGFIVAAVVSALGWGAWKLLF